MSRQNQTEDIQGEARNLGENLQDISWGESAREIVSKLKEVAPESGELFKSYLLLLLFNYSWAQVYPEVWFLSPVSLHWRKLIFPFLLGISWKQCLDYQWTQCPLPILCAWILSGLTCAGLLRVATVSVSAYVPLSVVSRKHFLCVL